MTAQTYLVPELGLRNTRRNRRWLAIFHALADTAGGAQERHERVAWRALKALEVTRRGSRDRRRLVEDALRDLGGGQELLEPLIQAVEHAYYQTA